MGGGDVVPRGGRRGSKGVGADVEVRGETLERGGFAHALGQTLGRERRVAVLVDGVQGEGLEGDAERERVGARGGVRRGEVALESKMDARYRHLEVAEDGVEHASQPSVAGGGGGGGGVRGGGRRVGGVGGVGGGEPGGLALVDEASLERSLRRFPPSGALLDGELGVGLGEARDHVQLLDADHHGLLAERAPRNLERELAHDAAQDAEGQTERVERLDLQSHALEDDVALEHGDAQVPGAYPVHVFAEHAVQHRRELPLEHGDPGVRAKRLLRRKTHAMTRTTRD